MFEELRLKFNVDMTDDEWAGVIEEVTMRVQRLREGDIVERVFAYVLEELVETDDDMDEGYL
jgi:hypothetical protein